jgi:RNA polymerase sigma-70 factor (ECF subfamily)
MIEEAERALMEAARQNRPGRFQLEAALQSAHVERVRSGRIDWEGIAVLYEGLVRTAPTVGALVGRAAAVAEARDAAAGLALLEAIPVESVKTYQPYWAVRAHLLQRTRQSRQALEAFDRAIGLTEDEAIRKFLWHRKSGSG